MKVYIISGEASGDLHASAMLKEMNVLNPHVEARAWGGDLLQAQGAIIVKHYRELAFMGFKEVIMNLPTIFKNISFCKKDILQFKPDVLVLVDYPGFNMRIAKWAKEVGLKVVYYISPQVWAWKESRVKALKRDVDKLLVILPFEVDFFKKHGLEVSFVGHPLPDRIDQYNTPFSFLEDVGFDDAKPIIALLPGSRKQEISILLPIMLEACKSMIEVQIGVAGAPSQPDELYHSLMIGYPNVKLVRNGTYSLLSSAHAALVTSGTATLETALFGVPLAVAYKGGYISYQIGKRLVKVKYISLVNLIADKKIVEEFIQGECTPDTLQKELNKLLKEGEYRSTMIHHLSLLKDSLHGEGASKRAALEVLKVANKA